MTLKTTRLVRNMLGIGGTVCVGTFGFSLASSKSSITKIHDLNINHYKKLSIKPEEIQTVSHIEDFEYSKGCKFLFYDEKQKSTVFGEGSFQDARDVFSKTEGVIESVQKNAKSCVEGSYVFIDFAAAKAAKKSKG